MAQPVNPLAAAVKQLEKPIAFKLLALCSSPREPPQSGRQPNPPDPLTTSRWTWFQVEETKYIEPGTPEAKRWDDYRIVRYLVDNAVHIPPKSAKTGDPWVTVTQNGTSTTLPRGYRIPLLWLQRVQWDCLRLALSVGKPVWPWVRFDLLHIARATVEFLEKARTEPKIKRGWREPAFDRLLTRFFNGWMGCAEIFVFDFWMEFKELEYKEDVLGLRWQHKVPKGIQGFVVTEQEIVESIPVAEFTKGLKIDDINGTVEWSPPPEADLPSSPAQPSPVSIGSSPLTSDGGSEHGGIPNKLHPKPSEPSTPTPGSSRTTPGPSRPTPAPLAIPTAIPTEPVPTTKRSTPKPRPPRPEKSTASSTSASARPIRTRAQNGSVSSPAITSAGPSATNSPAGIDFTAPVESRGRKRKIETVYSSTGSPSSSPLTSDDEDTSGSYKGSSYKGSRTSAHAQSNPPSGRAFTTQSRIVIPRLTAASGDMYNRPTSESYAARTATDTTLAGSASRGPSAMSGPTAASSSASVAPTSSASNHHLSRKPSLSLSESGSPRKRDRPPVSVALTPLQQRSFKLSAIASSPSSLPFDPSKETLPAMSMWRNSAELDYIGPTHPSVQRGEWSDWAIADYMYTNVFTIPSRAIDNKIVWVEVRMVNIPPPPTQVQNGDPMAVDGAPDPSAGHVLLIPRGYRIPLLFLARVQWDAFKTLVVQAPDYWDELKFDLLHIARLLGVFLAKARTEPRIKRNYRDVMFDRPLSRFFAGWMGSRDEFVYDFYREFKEEEYEDDMIGKRWLQKVQKGIQGYALTEDELNEGITAEQHMQGFEIDREKKTFAWVVDGKRYTIPPDPETAAALGAATTTATTATTATTIETTTPAPAPIATVTDEPMQVEVKEAPVQPEPNPPPVPVPQPQPLATERSFMEIAASPSLSPITPITSIRSDEIVPEPVPEPVQEPQTEPQPPVVVDANMEVDETPAPEKVVAIPEARDSTSPGGDLSKLFTPSKSPSPERVPEPATTAPESQSLFASPEPHPVELPSEQPPSDEAPEPMNEDQDDVDENESLFGGSDDEPPAAADASHVTEEIEGDNLFGSSPPPESMEDAPGDPADSFHSWRLWNAETQTLEPPRQPDEVEFNESEFLNSRLPTPFALTPPAAAATQLPVTTLAPKPATSSPLADPALTIGVSEVTTDEVPNETVPEPIEQPVAGSSEPEQEPQPEQEPEEPQDDSESIRSSSSPEPRPTLLLGPAPPPVLHDPSPFVEHQPPLVEPTPSEPDHPMSPPPDSELDEEEVAAVAQPSSARPSSVVGDSPASPPAANDEVSEFDELDELADDSLPREGPAPAPGTGVVLPSKNAAHVVPIGASDAADEFPPGFHFMGSLPHEDEPLPLPARESVPEVVDHDAVQADAEKLVSSMPEGESKQVKLEIMATTLSELLNATNNEPINVDEEEEPQDMDMGTPIGSPVPAQLEAEAETVAAPITTAVPETTPAPSIPTVATARHELPPKPVSSFPEPVPLPPEYPRHAPFGVGPPANRDQPFFPGANKPTNGNNTNGNMYGPNRAQPYPNNRRSPPPRSSNGAHGHGHRPFFGKNGPGPGSGFSKANSVVPRPDAPQPFANSAPRSKLFSRDRETNGVPNVPPAPPPPPQMPMPMPTETPTDNDEYDPRRPAYSMPLPSPGPSTYSRWMPYGNANANLEPSPYHQPYSPLVSLSNPPMSSSGSASSSLDGSMAASGSADSLYNPQMAMPVPVQVPVPVPVSIPIPNRVVSPMRRSSSLDTVLKPPTPMPMPIQVPAAQTQVPAVLDVASSDALRAFLMSVAPEVLRAAAGSSGDVEMGEARATSVPLPQPQPQPSRPRSPARISELDMNTLENSLMEQLKADMAARETALSERLSAQFNAEMQTRHDALSTRLSGDFEVRQNALSGGLVDRLRNELRSELVEEMRAEMRREVGSEWKGALQGELKDALLADLHGSFRAGMRDELRTEMVAQIQDHVPGRVRDEVFGELKGELMSRMREEMMVPMRESLLGPLKEQLMAEMKAEMVEGLKDELLSRLKDDLAGQLQGDLRSLLQEDLKERLQGELSSALESNLRNVLRDDLKEHIVAELKDHFASQLQEQLKALGHTLQTAMNSQLRDDLAIQMKFFVAKLKDDLIGQLKDTLTVHLQDGMLTQVKAALTAQLKEGLGAQREQLNQDFERRRQLLEQQQHQQPRSQTPARTTASPRPMGPPTPAPKPLSAPSSIFLARHPLHHLVLDSETGVDVDVTSGLFRVPTSPALGSPSRASVPIDAPVPVKSQRKQSWFVGPGSSASIAALAGGSVSQPPSRAPTPAVAAAAAVPSPAA